MKFTLALLATLGLSASALPNLKMRQMQFSAWVKEHNKQYTADEFFMRFENFQSNMKAIEEHNASGKSWTTAMNHLGDLSKQEYTNMLGYKHDATRAKNYATEELASVEAPGAVDWRTKGAVTPVKDQGHCGSCWAFSTTGSTEGRWQIAKGELPNLSEQQLVDCAAKEGNKGCNGGLMDFGFQYIIDNGGIDTEASYPYVAKAELCAGKEHTSSGVTLSSFKDVPESAADLEAAVAVGPVSIAIEADQSAFQFYQGGIVSGICGKKLDHGVLAVGYDNTGPAPYWIVKNSWGAQWGEQGFVRIAKGEDECGIYQAASYPVV